MWTFIMRSTGLLFRASWRLTLYYAQALEKVNSKWDSCCSCSLVREMTRGSGWSWRKKQERKKTRRLWKPLPKKSRKRSRFGGEYCRNSPDRQEAPVSITFGRHVSNQFKLIYSESWRRELLIGIYMSRIGRGGGPGGSRVFWTPPPKMYWVTSAKL